MGHKLAALSTLYEILYKEFGEADVFYTVDDEENTLAFDWFFIDIDKQLQSIKNNDFFDDDAIKDYVIFNKSDNQKREILRRKTGLPIELTDYIDEFLLYKNGQEIMIPDNAKIDGVLVKKLSRK